MMPRPLKLRPWPYDSKPITNMWLSSIIKGVGRVEESSFSNRRSSIYHPLSTSKPSYPGKSRGCVSSHQACCSHCDLQRNGKSPWRIVSKSHPHLWSIMKSSIMLYHVSWWLSISTSYIPFLELHGRWKPHILEPHAPGIHRKSIGISRLPSSLASMMVTK